MEYHHLETATALVARAQKAGADAVDAIVTASSQLNAGIRLGVPETIERAESQGVGLRVFCGESSATLSTADLSEAGLAKLVESAIAIARVAPPDAYAALADSTRLAKSLPDLELVDALEPSIDMLLARAKACEAAGREVPGIRNSEGADASFSASHVALASSHGVAAAYRQTYSSLSLSLIAGEGDAMQRDYAYRTTRFASELPDAGELGREAATRTLAKLNPTKIASQTMPIAFDPRVAKSLVSAFASAINGSAIARGTSFLKDAMGTQIFAPHVTIIDDPLMKRGLGSRPIDAEGVAPEKRHFIDKGVLTSWLLDTRSANQLGLATTGHASRGLSSAPHPSPSNLYIAAGSQTPEALLKNAGTVFYVTETFGHGVNLITGDYSQGASGFLYVNGERREAVSEVTIAGNLREMFAGLTPANDVQFHYATNAPTLLVARMTVAGT
jgi:PmbA protein